MKRQEYEFIDGKWVDVYEAKLQKWFEDSVLEMKDYPIQRYMIHFTSLYTAYVSHLDAYRRKLTTP